MFIYGELDVGKEFRGILNPSMITGGRCVPRNNADPAGPAPQGRIVQAGIPVIPERFAQQRGLPPTGTCHQHGGKRFTARSSNGSIARWQYRYSRVEYGAVGVGQAYSNGTEYA